MRISLYTMAADLRPLSPDLSALPRALCLPRETARRAPAYLPG